MIEIPKSRSVFFGTPDFAVPILEATAAVTELVAVITQPDRPKGRGQELAPPPTKVWALSHGLPVFQPTKLRDGVLAASLRPLAPDVAVVAAYGRILPRELLDLPRLGCVNTHASILPRYRGAAPIQWALAEGETETGVVLMRMNEGLDTGDVLFEKRLPIAPDDTGGSLHDKLFQLGAEAIREGLPRYLAGELIPVPQDHARATLAPMLEKVHGRLDFTRSAPELERRVRAFEPWPGTFTFLAPNGQELLKVTKARVSERPHGTEAASPGTVIAARPLLVACGGDTALELVEVQPQGRTRMAGGDLVLGRKVAVGQRLDPDR